MTHHQEKMGAYAETWRRAYGGHPIWGLMARYLMQLEQEHGREKVAAHWERYCRETAAPFVNIPKFAATFGSWAPVQKAVEVKPRGRQYLTADQLDQIAEIS